MLWYLGKETVIFSYYIPVGIAVKRIMAGCSFNRFSPSGFCVFSSDPFPPKDQNSPFDLVAHPKGLPLPDLVPQPVIETEVLIDQVTSHVRSPAPKHRTLVCPSEGPTYKEDAIGKYQRT